MDKDTNETKGKEGNHHRKDVWDMEWKKGARKESRRGRVGGKLNRLNRKGQKTGRIARPNSMLTAVRFPSPIFPRLQPPLESTPIIMWGLTAWATLPWKLNTSQRSLGGKDREPYLSTFTSWPTSSELLQSCGQSDGCHAHGKWQSKTSEWCGTAVCRSCYGDSHSGTNVL